MSILTIVVVCVVGFVTIVFLACAFGCFWVSHLCSEEEKERSGEDGTKR